MNKSAWTLIPALGLFLFAAIPTHSGQAGSAPPATSEAKPQSNGPATITLDELVETALRNNPAIHGSKQAADAKHARVSAAETLPEPTISFQTMGDFFTLQKADPSSGRTYSVEQEIPFPGKLGLKGKIATAEAEAEDWNHETTRRQVIADLKAAYYDLYLIVKSIDSAEKTRGLLLDFSRIAESKYRVGAGAQQDVIKAQVEVSKIADRLTVLEQKRGISEARIRNLIYDRRKHPSGNPRISQRPVCNTLRTSWNGWPWKIPPS